MKDTAIKILNGAKDVLRERGWFQGGMEVRQRGPCCLLHALQESAGMRGSYLNSEPQLPVDVAYRALLDVTGAEPDRLGRWNDGEMRTLEEVYQALDKAIEKLST